jgi:hypothetical protein
MAISPSGDMAVSINRRNIGSFQRVGTLAQTGLAGGGATREILEDVFWADWVPGKPELAVVRSTGRGQRVEFPIGKSVYETTGWISHLRVAPSGDSVAFLDHPVPSDDGGTVAIVDRGGKKKTLTEPFATGAGLAWTPRGEIWFTAAPVGNNRALYSVTTSGRQRLRARVTGNLTVEDIFRDGRLLMSQAVERQGLVALPPGEAKERDISWLDWSSVSDISRDGKTVPLHGVRHGRRPRDTRSTCERPTARRRCVSPRGSRRPSLRTEPGSWESWTGRLRSRSSSSFRRDRASRGLCRRPVSRFRPPTGRPTGSRSSLTRRSRRTASACSSWKCRAGSTAP